MKLESITKGNYNLELTKETFKHEKNLRFHVKIDDRYFEYALDGINKTTINIQCVVRNQKKLQTQQKRCYARITLKETEFGQNTEPESCSDNESE